MALHDRADPELDVNRLLYIRIAPRQMRSRTSTQNLRTRVHYHYRGTAEGSTLRLTLGCLLGLELRRVGSGKSMTFGPAGEATLNEWMQDNARVCWYSCPEPWVVKPAIIGQADLPLNLDQNHDHPFHDTLSATRSAAKARAKELPVLN